MYIFLLITKKKFYSLNMSIVPKIKMKITQKNCIKLSFIDSFKFLSTNLDKLVLYFDKKKN